MRSESIKKAFHCMAIGASLLLATGAYADEAKPDQVTVAYFLEWPTADLVPQAQGSYDKELGVKVNWRAFDTGTAIMAAMASGDVQIGRSIGLPPFIIAASRGVPVEIISVSVSAIGSTNCVVDNRSGIDPADPKSFEGKKVALPFGTAAEFTMIKSMDHRGVDPSKLRLVDMAPPDVAAAMSRGDLAIGCGWGGPLAKMREYGKELMTEAELKAAGVRDFDTIVVRTDFAQKYPDLVTKFLRVTDQADRYLKDHPDAAKPIIAKASGMDLAASNATLATFDFPMKDEQLSKGWLGTKDAPGDVALILKEYADFLVQRGVMPKALDSYKSAVDPTFYQNVEY